MKRSVLLCALMVCFSGVARAQEHPAVETSFDYSYVHVSDSGFTANLNGGSASVAFNPSSWLGVVADFGGYKGSQNGFDGGNVITYMFGPKVAMRRGRVTPYAQALFGGAHADIAGTTSNAFAMALGGGVDANLTEHIGVRVIQAEYLMTRFNFVSNQQNNVRISAGVVFRF
jgi:opacity protein-like surface antigen